MRRKSVPYCAPYLSGVAKYTLVHLSGVAKGGVERSALEGARKETFRARGSKCSLLNCMPILYLNGYKVF